MIYLSMLDKEIIIKMDAKTIEFRLLTKDSAIGTISIKRCADKLLMLKDKYSKKRVKLF